MIMHYLTRHETQKVRCTKKGGRSADTMVQLQCTKCTKLNERTRSPIIGVPRIRGNTRGIGHTTKKEEPKRNLETTLDHVHYRIKKLCAIANAHTAAHARNPSGYPDGSSCVLADQSCHRIHVRVSRAVKQGEKASHVAPKNRPEATRKTYDTLCSAVSKTNCGWRGHCLRRGKGGSVLAQGWASVHGTRRTVI